MIRLGEKFDEQKGGENNDVQSCEQEADTGTD
jgi:hypothetical protein